MIEIKCFAQIREITQVDEMLFPYEKSMCIAELKKQLERSDDKWRRAFSMQPLIACNHLMVKPEHKLNDGDEIAFFPPVTGG